ncbi:MAG: hypothetical protein J2P34_10080, partial [Actinobacteria bacterium]|nr:hypothetical protein [Actinomycetota bacterium]
LAAPGAPARRGGPARPGAPARPVARPAAGRPAGGQRKHRRLRRILLATVVLTLAVLVSGLYYLLHDYLLRGVHRAQPLSAAPATQPAATPSTSSAPPGPWKFLQSRADDPRPLTLNELFPARFSVRGASAARTAGRRRKQCGPALLGAALETAAMKAHCTQVLRATYLSSDRTVMATIGVLNLVNAAAAGRVAKASGASAFIDPLAAAHGPTHNIRKGTGIEEPVVKGHYLILIWTEFTNLHRPATAAQRKQLVTFASDLFAGTANVSLSSRMVTGKPAAAANAG